ncbi:hypothetical protein [Spirosoma pomorum]
MKTRLIQLLVVMVVVGVCVYAYDYVVLKPTRDEQARRFAVTKVPAPADKPLSYVAFT